MAGTGAGFLAGAWFMRVKRGAVATFASMELYETGSSSDPWLALHTAEFQNVDTFSTLFMPNGLPRQLFYILIMPNSGENN